MSFLPPIDECLVGLYSANATNRADAAIFLWSHVISHEQTAERERIIHHLVKKIEDPNYHVRFAVIYALHAACFYEEAVNIAQQKYEPRRVARALLQHVSMDDRGLPEVCCNLLGFLLRKNSLGLRNLVKLSFISTSTSRHRTAIKQGWAKAN
jgi:hypothetical protein